MQYIEIDNNIIDNLTSYEDFKLINSIANNSYVNHASKKKKKKPKTILGKALASVGKGLKKASQSIAKATKTAVEYTALVPLKPFEPLMRSMLKKRGKKPPSKFSELVNVFYNEVVRKTNGYEHFEEIDINNVPKDHVAPAISAIVSGIIEFIKNIKRKKAQGQILTKTEEEIYKGTVEVERQLEEKAKAEAAQTVGQKILFDRQTQLLIIAAIVILIIILKNK